MMRRIPVVLFLLCLHTAAQAPTGSPQATPPAASAAVRIPTAPSQSQLSPLLSPQAAYDQANLPVDITRNDTSNWSDTELAALDVAVAQAKAACIARATETYTEADLVGYARLCAMGKEWKATYLAATTYINGTWPKPLLADAYAYEVQADMNLSNARGVQGACLAMLRSVPYNELTDEVTSSAIRFLQFAYLPLALDLAFQRQPYLLNLLRGMQPPDVGPASGAAQIPSVQPAAGVTSAPAGGIPIHTLFEHALVLAELQQFNNQPERAAAVVADVDHAMPAQLPQDEAILVAADRRQYALLGTPFPTLTGALNLRPATGTPPPGKVILGESTLLLLFPPWCAQCIRQSQDILPFLQLEAKVAGSDEKLHIYSLLADNPPPAEPPTKPIAHATAQPARTSHQDRPAAEPIVTVTVGKPPPPAEQLRGTPTLVVAPSMLSDFNAMNFPFLIAVDHDGIIRLMVAGAPKNLMVQGGPAEQISDTILQLWRPKPSH